MNIFSDRGFTPNISYNTVHASTIFKLVENNFGFSIIPSTLQFGYELDIKFIKLDKIPQRTVLSVVWNSKNRNPILKKILEYIA